MGLNQAQNEVFPHLLEFGSYVFLEIAYNDSLLQCLTPSRGKIHKKKVWRLKFGQNGQYRVVNLFFHHFLNPDSLVFF